MAFYREDNKGEKIIVVVNFSDVTREPYEFGVPDKGKYEVILNSSAKGHVDNTIYETIDESFGEIPQKLKIKLEGNSALYLKLIKED